MLAVVIIWAVPTSPVQAKLTNDQCNQKMGELDADSRDKSDGMNGDSVEYARIWYKTHLTVKNLLETECTQVVDANYALEARINYMNLMGERCAKKGAGSNCGITLAGVDSSSTTSSNNSSTNQNQTTNDAPPTKKLSAAEQKRQQAQQKADDLSTQSQQLAQENQSKADAARQGKRKKHDPAAEAHHCIKVNEGGLFGSMDNKCNFKIWYVDCGYRPTEKSWLKSMACENQKFGLSTVGPNKRDPSHTRHVEKMYWFACKDPARPVDYKFIEGSGIHGRCFDTANSVFD